MSQRVIQQLRGLTSFPTIFAYLRDELDWTLETENIQEEDVTFEYTSADLGLAKEHAAKIHRIRQLRQLQRDQPWAVFYIEFDDKHLPVTVLRSILRKLTQVREDRPGWDMEDLLFITLQGTSSNRSIAFSHFRKGGDHRLPELRSFGWDGDETHFYYIQNLNLENLRWQKRGESVNAWRDRWREAFISRPSVVITESRQLATAMAGQARFMRDAILETYALEHPSGIWHTLMNEVQIELIHDLSDRSFADVIAQTITYGLFSAAEQNPGFMLADLVTAIPPTNPFLRDLLTKLVDEPRIDLIALGIDRLIILYRDAQVPDIAQQFMRRTASGKEDPVILFYEQFLNEYDRAQRVERGVFYTPDPVVHYIVHSVDAILKEEFGIAEGLASAEKLESGDHRVQILDPATGTGTFLAHIIDLVHDAKRGMNKDAWSEYVAADLLPRLNGFELMMAPYAIAHMKLGLKLEQTGYDFRAEDQRLRVFLTNALSTPTQSGEVLGENFLAREADEAAKVKKLKKIMVVIGNPPYSGHSANNSDYIRDLLHGKLPSGKKAANYFEVDGQPLNERNPKWLNDDYVKFVRMGQQRIEDTGSGVLAFITNHGYLDNPTFRGMRQALMTTFDAIYIVDLHGNSKKKEKAPDGGRDENVFDIQQGVSIGIFVKQSGVDGNKAPARVHHLDTYGARAAKYAALTAGSIADLLLHESGWRTFTPEKPFYLFTPQNADIQAEYLNSLEIQSLFQTNNMGITSGDDDRFISLSDVDLKSRFDDDTRIIEIAYRPFDVRSMFYAPELLARARQEFMQHFRRGNNLALSTLRRPRNQFVGNFYVSDLPTDKCIISTLDNAQIFPLYLYPDPNRHDAISTEHYPLSEKGRRPNLSPAFVAAVAGKLELTFITDGHGDLVNTFGPEDVFHYAYAVFHSPTYRQRYAEPLKIDFPRLPLTDNLVLFNQLVQRGADLVALHLLDDTYAAASWVLDGDESPLVETGVRFVPGKDGTTVGKFGNNNYDEQRGHVYLDSGKRPDMSYFEGISKDVWGFQIGGYQVLHKWLYDRRAVGTNAGRTLTDDEVTHYTRMVAALRATIALMAEIDEQIEEHGGFPLVGSVPNDEQSDNVGESDMSENTEWDGVQRRIFYVEGDQKSFGDLVRANGGDQPVDGDVQPPDYAIEIDTTPIYSSSDALTREEGLEVESEDLDEVIEITRPFDPTKIRMNAQQMSLLVLINRMKDDRLSIPRYQRSEGIWSEGKKSRLIESILIKIPLPAFYIDASNDDDWRIIDGLQRLTTLRQFIILKTMRLKGLEFLELEGKGYDDLPLKMQRRFEEMQVAVYFVEEGTPPEVTYNIFKHINTGGEALSAQEIRNALNQGPAVGFLEELAKSSDFLAATGKSIKPLRKADQEVVLRFMAFVLSPERRPRNNDLDAFMNDAMAQLNRMSADERQRLARQFIRAMQAAHNILGEFAFRKIMPSGRRGQISRALFDAWALNFDSLTDEHIARLSKHPSSKLLGRFKQLLKNPEFDKAITASTGDPGRIQTRYNMLRDIIEQTLGGQNA